MNPQPPQSVAHSLFPVVAAAAIGFTSAFALVFAGLTWFGDKLLALVFGRDR